MRDRLSAAAHKVGYSGDLSELAVSTIHSLCNRLITQHRHRTPLGHNYDTLDELTQLLFIFEHFDEIIGPAENDLFLGRWKTRWTAIEGARAYFDKITEEIVDPVRLQQSGVSLLAALGKAYQSYEHALIQANRIDFAHLQRTVLDLLEDRATCEAVTRQYKYVLVDEYQDTNYVQERLLLKLTEATRNLSVVGDEDQSLYRFRGATVRNILSLDRACQGVHPRRWRPTTVLLGASLNATTGGWRPLIGPTAVELPSDMTRPSRPTMLPRTPTTLPSLRFGERTSAMRPHASLTWSSSSRRM